LGGEPAANDRPRSSLFRTDRHHHLVPGIKLVQEGDECVELLRIAINLDGVMSGLDWFPTFVAAAGYQGDVAADLSLKSIFEKLTCKEEVIRVDIKR
jgi:hypothetical protein